MFLALKRVFQPSIQPKSNWSRPTTEAECFAFRYLTQMRDSVSRAPKLAWKSRYIASSSKVGAVKATRIVEQVFSDRKFQAEIAKAIRELGGPQSPHLWDVYFRRCYNAITGLSQGYIQLLLETSRNIPKAGAIYDLGGGTGNFSTSLLSLSSQRQVTLVDMSPEAIRVAHQTVRKFAVGSRFAALKRNLRTPGIKQGSGDAAVINNVLYTLGNNQQKLSFLRKVHAALKPDAIVVRSDPKPNYQRDERTLCDWLVQVVSSAAYHRSPMSAFNVALYAEINRKILNGKSSPFLSEEKLISLAHEAGFALIAPPESRFYGIDTYLVLRRLTSPKVGK